MEKVALTRLRARKSGLYLQVLKEILSGDSPAALVAARWWKLSYRCTLHNLSPCNAFPSEGEKSSLIFRRDIDRERNVTCIYSLFFTSNTAQIVLIKDDDIKTRRLNMRSSSAAEIALESVYSNPRIKDLYVHISV